jgi:hypothetical protein
MVISPADLDHYESLALAATEGPWACDPLDIGTLFNIEDGEGVSVAMAAPIPGDRNNEQRQANADFMAAMNPQTVIALIAQLRAVMQA